MKKLTLPAGWLMAAIFASTLALAPQAALAQSCKGIEFDEVQNRFTEAMKLMNGKKYQEAIPHLKCCVEYNPKWGSGWAALGDCYLMLKDTKNATTAYNNAIKVGHKSASMTMNFASMALKAGDKAKAKEVMQTLDVNALEAAEKAPFLAMRGKIELDDKDYSAAMKDFEAAFAIEKKSSHAYYGGLAAMLSNNDDKAVTLLREAVRLDAKNLDAHYRLADLLMRKAQRENADALWGEAAKFAEVIVAAKPGEVKYQRLLGDARIGQKQFDAGIAALQKAASLDATHCLTKHNLGRAYSFKKDWDNAIKHLLDAAKCNPKDSKIQNDLGWSYENKFKATKSADLLNQADAAYKKANALKPGSASAHLTRVEALKTNSAADEADTASSARQARYETEKKRLMASVKLSELKRSTSVVGGKTITLIFGVIKNQSDTLVNAVVEVVFINTGGKELGRAKTKVDGIQPGKSRPLEVEAEGVDKAADYRVQIVDLVFQLKG